MKKHIAFLLLLLCSAYASHGQDQDARAHYQKAEAAYLAGKWPESLQHLQQAEEQLGKRTPKVQFLKVLVYEKMALENIDALPPALAEVRSYLDMENQLPPLHKNYLPTIRQIESTLPARARSNHDARVQQKLQQEKIAWQNEANKTRLGFFAALPNPNTLGTELGIIVGSRARLWVFSSSTAAPMDISIDDDFNVKVVDKLNQKADGEKLHTTILSVAYLQGIRVMPRERDVIKPFIGVRALYHGEYGRTFETDNEQLPHPDPQVIANIRSYGLDPGDFYEMKTTFTSGFSADVVVGAMFHLGGTTMFAGMDVINSKRLQFGVAFKIQ